MIAIFFYLLIRFNTRVAFGGIASLLQALPHPGYKSVYAVYKEIFSCVWHLLKCEKWLKIGYNPDNVHSKEIYPEIVLSKSDLADCAEYKCNIGDFAGGYVCKKDGDQKNICNGGGFTASTDGLKCENGSDLCPEDYVLDMQYSSGVITSTAINGSIIFRPRFFADLKSASLDAISNARTLESTS